jgi:hypothetical protein
VRRMRGKLGTGTERVVLSHGHGIRDRSAIA